MRVIHILKRIEAIDEDIKELRKIEKSITRNKSFSTPIYMSIEKQINIMLGDKIKLLELNIANPPANLVKEIEGTDIEEKPANNVNNTKTAKKTKTETKPVKNKSKAKIEEDDDEDNDIGIVTQDLIDEKFERIKKETLSKIDKTEDDSYFSKDDINDDSVKLLDVALEKGSLVKESDKDKKKVRFFKDNFPGGEY